MKKIVEELSQLVTFKETTDVGDIVLITAKEPQMLVFAHVDKVERDFSRKEEWWHVQLSILSLPLQQITWTLRTEQMTGQEIFTMGGEERFVKAVAFDQTNKTPQTQKKPISKSAGLKRVK